jgi:hypothetical protein
MMISMQIDALKHHTGNQESQVMPLSEQAGVISRAGFS